MTDLERRCLALTADGLRPEEIGSRIGVRKADVETFLHSAQTKLNAKTMLQAVARFVARNSDSYAV